MARDAAYMFARERFTGREPGRGERVPRAVARPPDGNAALVKT